MEWSEISVIGTIAAAVIGVYVDGKVRLAIMQEKLKNLENNFHEQKVLHDKVIDSMNDKVENMFSKIFDKLSEIEKELQHKANINLNGK